MKQIEIRIAIMIVSFIIGFFYGSMSGKKRKDKRRKNYKGKVLLGVPPVGYTAAERRWFSAKAPENRRNKLGVPKMENPPPRPRPKPIGIKMDVL